jgi:DNA-binding NarL/FixJ family response regulator
VNASNRLRVFVVEDNPLIRDRLVETLTSTGHIDVVGHAESEREAVDALGGVQWDALVLDLQLRHGTGLGVLRAIGPSRPEGAKILVLTTYAIPMLRDRSLALGADAFLDKAREYDRAVDLLVDLARGRASSA